MGICATGLVEGSYGDRNEHSASRDARATCENVCSHMLIVASTLGTEIWARSPTWRLPRNVDGRKCGET